MDEDILRVAWICGAPGAGKSVTSWRLWTNLVGDGVPAAYVDIDQLGMLYPEESTDPHRHTLKAAALSALVPGYRACGVRTLVVSGVIDPVRGAAQMTSAADSVSVTVCLLTAAEEDLRHRLDDRGWSFAAQDASVAEQRALVGSGVTDVVVEGAGRTIDELAVDIRRLLPRGRATGAQRATPAPRAAIR